MTKVADSLTYYVNDTSPSFVANLSNKTGYQSLAGCTAKLVLVHTTIENLVVEVELSITNEETGEVTGEWAVGQLSIAGRYRFYVVVTFPDSKTRTWPTDQVFYINVKEL